MELKDFQGVNTSGSTAWQPESPDRYNFDSVCFSEVQENDFQCEQPNFPGTNSLCFKHNLNDNYDNWDVEKPDSDRERGKVRLLMENNP